MAITGQLTLNEILIVEVDVDPSTAGGISAPIGSFALLDDKVNGKFWLKSGAGNTAWALIPRLADSTAFTAGSIYFSDTNGFNAQNNANLFWDNTAFRLGLGITTPQSRIHIDNGTATASAIKFTVGTTTGQTAGDGFEVGVDTAGNGELRQREASAVNIFSSNTRYLQLTSAGQFLIGASVAAVDINGASTFPVFQIIGTTATTTQMAAVTYSNDTAPPTFNLLKSRGALNTQGILAAGDELGRLQFRGSDGVNFQAGASVRAAVDALGTVGANSMPGRLSLQTTGNGSVTPTERLYIDSTGLVRVADLFQTKRIVKDFTTQATSASTLTMTGTSASVQIFTGTVAAQLVNLPDATTIPIGIEYTLYNNSTKDVVVRDGSGATLETLFSGTGYLVARLVTAGTVAGSWVTRSQFEAFHSEVSSTATQTITTTTDVVVTSMTLTPPAGTYYVVFDSSVAIANTNATFGCAIYSNGIINTNSQRNYQAASGGTENIKAITTTATVTVDGTQAIDVRAKRSAGNAVINTRTLHIMRTA